MGSDSHQIHVRPSALPSPLELHAYGQTTFPSSLHPLYKIIKRQSEEEEEKEEPFEKAYGFVASHFLNSLVNKGLVGGKNDLFLSDERSFFLYLFHRGELSFRESITRERIGISWTRIGSGAVGKNGGARGSATDYGSHVRAVKKMLPRSASTSLGPVCVGVRGSNSPASRRARQCLSRSWPGNISPTGDRRSNRPPIVFFSLSFSLSFPVTRVSECSESISKRKVAGK